MCSNGALVRRTNKLKLLDAMILATAQVSGRVLVTRNTKDFGEGGKGAAGAVSVVGYSSKFRSPGQSCVKSSNA